MRCKVATLRRTQSTDLRACHTMVNYQIHFSGNNCRSTYNNTKLKSNKDIGLEIMKILYLITKIKLLRSCACFTEL